MVCCRAVIFCVLLLAIVRPTFAAGLADYAGQYVLKLGTRNFLVLRLNNVQGKLTGTLTRPRHASLGSSFSQISSEVVTEPITSAVLQQNHLHLIATNPTDPSDVDPFDLTLLPPDHASLKISDFPIDPWTLTRVPDMPLQSVATDWDSHHTYYPDETEQSNPEMQRIFAEDQKVRQSADMAHADWATIDKSDKEHQKQVHELLSHRALHTGQDFGQAAFIFQHGSTPDDYLLAHTLAMIAIARGNPGALWIATATLDRYLQSINQPQIYGTQFPHGKTQEPYNRTLISDELRRQLGVPSQATQQKQLKEYQSTSQH